MTDKRNEWLKCRCGDVPVRTVGRSEQFDAYYCTRCFMWLESTCSDSSCVFCPERPADARTIDLLA